MVKASEVLARTMRTAPLASMTKSVFRTIYKTGSWATFLGTWTPPKEQWKIFSPELLIKGVVQAILVFWCMSCSMFTSLLAIHSIGRRVRRRSSFQLPVLWNAATSKQESLNTDPSYMSCLIAITLLFEGVNYWALPAKNLTRKGSPNCVDITHTLCTGTYYQYTWMPSSKRMGNIILCHSSIDLNIIDDERQFSLTNGCWGNYICTVNSLTHG